MRAQKIQRIRNCSIVAPTHQDTQVMADVDLIDLSKKFGDVRAVDAVRLHVRAGELLALLGPSGCGKTTTMRMIAGLLAPTAGDICFDGVSVLETPAERRGAVMVFQKHLLFPNMSVLENVGFGLKMRGVDRRESRRRAEAMLARVQLAGMGKRRAHELSGGQQQRVALARALVVEPRVLLLDEPLANLDANLRLDMRRLIRTIQQELGITTIFVTHDQEEAIMLADRVALMMDGRLLQVDQPAALYERPASAAVARFFRNENLLAAVKDGANVTSALGCFCHAQPDVPDGPVLLSVRPEHLQAAADTQANVCSGVVREVVYMGAYTRVQLSVADINLTAHLAPSVKPAVGDHLCVGVLPSYLWLMPP